MTVDEQSEDDRYTQQHFEPIQDPDDAKSVNYEIDAYQKEEETSSAYEEWHKGALFSSSNKWTESETVTESQQA